MSKIEQGILGGFSGKTGPVVGYIRKGYCGMRIYKRHNKSNTLAQQKVRLAFAKSVELQYQFYSAVRSGLEKSAKGQDVSIGNYFVEKNFFNVTVDNRLDTHVDWQGLVIAEGKLPEVSFDVIDFSRPNTVKVGFSSNMQVEGASATDQVFLYVFCEQLGMGVKSVPPAERQDGVISIEVPASFNGLKVHVYGWCVGRSVQMADVPSNSAYLGYGIIS